LPLSLSIISRSMLPIFSPLERRTGVPSTRSLAIRLCDWLCLGSAVLWLGSLCIMSVCMVASVDQSVRPRSGSVDCKAVMPTEQRLAGRPRSHSLALGRQSEMTFLRNVISLYLIRGA
jgi:hypothetical protein